jgi:hypothetical protein
LTPSSEPRGFVELTTTVARQQGQVVATHLAQGPQRIAREGPVQELLSFVAGTFPRTSQVVADHSLGSG